MSSSWLANFKVKKMGSKESSVGVTFGPNWSGRQVGLCLAGAAVYAAFAAVIPQMGWPLSAMAVTLTGMGVLKGQAARKQMQFENALFRGHKRWMPFEKMQKISARGCGRIWIGFGFGWDVSHCQSEAEISKSDWREAYQKSLNNALCRRYLMGHFWEALAHPVATMNQVAVMRRMVSDSPGYRWIHALGKEQPQYLSKRDLEGHLAIFGTTGAGKSRLLECLIVQAILRHETVFVVDPKGTKGWKIPCVQPYCEPDATMIFFSFIWDIRRIPSTSTFLQTTQERPRSLPALPILCPGREETGKFS